MEILIRIVCASIYLLPIRFCLIFGILTGNERAQFFICKTDHKSQDDSKITQITNDAKSILKIYTDKIVSDLSMWLDESFCYDSTLGDTLISVSCEIR